MITTKELNKLKNESKPPLLKNSAKKLLEVKKAFLAESELYDQASAPDILYSESSDYSQVDEIETACGSPACMVGWLIWVEAKYSPKKYVNLLRDFGNSLDGFVKILGITTREAEELYCGEFTDKERKRAAKNLGHRLGWWSVTNGPGRQQAALGAARIDLFIESHRLI